MKEWLFFLSVAALVVFIFVVQSEDRAACIAQGGVYLPREAACVAPPPAPRARP